jgi:hypothetical protein
MEKAQNLPTELMAQVLRMTQYSKCFFFKKIRYLICCGSGWYTYISHVLVSAVTFVKNH